MNERARSRRRLLRALGGSGVAVGAVLAADWCKPVVKSVMLPVHAQTSSPSTPACTVSVTGAATAPSGVPYTLQVYIGTSVPYTTTSGSTGSVSASLSHTVALGTTYFPGVGILISDSAATGTIAFTESCCDGNTTFSNFPFPSGTTTDWATGVELSISDDGACEVVSG